MRQGQHIPNHMKQMLPLTRLLLAILSLAACHSKPSYDVLIRGGRIVDGSGQASYTADLGIKADTIAAIGELGSATGTIEIDAKGLAVAPGFINMLSWANEALIEDGRSQGEIRQGVTLEVMGEGHSMGPLNQAMKEEMKTSEQDIKYDISWSTLGEFLDYLEKKGVSTNIASFVGNGTLRQYVMGYENRPPSRDEMAEMKLLARQAMDEGAMGLSTALIYAPSSHASTSEIVELAKVVSRANGMYISHIRNEEEHLLEAVRELITVSKEAALPAEIYHFKASGTENWPLLDQAIAVIDSARAKGLQISTDMYMYNASSTGLNILLPSWAREGGIEHTIELMGDPKKRKQMIQEVKFHVPPDKILLVGFKNNDLRGLMGKTLAEVAQERGTSPEETVAALIEEDGSRIQVVYFSMSEENIKKKLALPYMAICSDAGSYTNEGVFLQQSTHPRAYGSFARLLGHYVREEKVISLEEAVYKLTTLPATHLKIKNRGALKVGYFADVVVFDPETIQAHSTYEDPHQYATGMVDVFVNGTQVIKDGEHTGAFPGRVIHGPGWRGH